VFGTLLALAAASEARFLYLGLVCSALAWAGIALVTAWLWRRMFPEHHDLTALTAAAAVAPVVVTTQVTTLTVVLPVMVPVLAGYGALIVLWAYVGGRGRGPGPLLSACGLVFGASLISEYVLAPAVVAMVLLGWRWLSGPDRQKRRAVHGVASVGVAAIAGSIVFRLTADFATRPDAQLSAI
jgi:hypothetical protein